MRGVDFGREIVRDEENLHGSIRDPIAGRRRTTCSRLVRNIAGKKWRDRIGEFSKARLRGFHVPVSDRNRESHERAVCPTATGAIEKHPHDLLVVSVAIMWPREWYQK